MAKKKVLILNGPNLNLLGKRQPEIYGRLTLRRLSKSAHACQELEMRSSFASPQRGRAVTWIQEAANKFGAIVINPTSVHSYELAMRDAVQR